MNKEQIKLMHEAKGFIAALDQSGGSTPKALKAYGVSEDSYKNENEMYDLVHEMRTRIMTSPVFTSEKIVGTILFEQTMDRTVNRKYTADYLWEEKGILPFLKVDKGLAEEKNGVQLMKDMPELDALLKRAVERHIFGTKERSVIHAANREGIAEVVRQQVEVGKQIFEAGLIPILEPEVTITIADKVQAEEILKEELLKALDALDEKYTFMLKLSIPTVANTYKELIAHPRVLRVVALSGGYEREEANKLLSENDGMIASFSRALLDGLFVNQSDEEYNEVLGNTIDGVYKASL